jgi:signal transduction histidine kinase
MTEIMVRSLKQQRGKSIELSDAEVELLARNAKRLETLTRNILDVTRLEGKRVLLKREKFDLNEAVRDSIEMSSGHVAGRISSGDGGSPEVVFLPSDEPLIVSADRTRVNEVVSNLLSNALRHAGQSGGGASVVITTWKGQDSTAFVRVKDSGPGIDEDAKGKLFSKFFTKSESGVGLGLYISKLIVEAHGGSIWGENNGGGERGASFVFTIPLAAAEQREQQEETQQVSYTPAERQQPPTGLDDRRVGSTRQ